MTPTTTPAQPALEDFEVRNLAAIPPLNGGKGDIVERRPIAYRRELEDQFVRGFRAAESHLHAQVAALTAAPGVQAGWKLVPIEPTDEMLQAAERGDREYSLRNFGEGPTVMQGPYDHWVAMIAAAPAQPAEGAAYAELPDFDAVEQHIYGACRRYITRDMLEPIHNLIREAIDADRASSAQAPAGATSDMHWNQAPCAHCGCTEGQHFNARCHHIQGETRYTPTAQPAPAADPQEDQTQPWYDLAWKHGARRHTPFDGDELTELSFSPAQFDAFCAELAPAAGAVAHTLSDAQIEVMPVWRNFVGLWPESRREIVDAVVELLAAAPTPASGAVAGPGWRVVPAEPTEAMFTRFSQQIEEGVVYVGGFLQAYRCMLDAAPTPAAQQGEAEKAHSTACLYQYALARLGLTDSVQLRVLFWDAANTLDWDEKTDWYVVPDVSMGCALCAERAALAQKEGGHE